jgi:hypothetical protein
MINREPCPFEDKPFCASVLISPRARDGRETTLFEIVVVVNISQRETVFQRESGNCLRTGTFSSTEARPQFDTKLLTSFAVELLKQLRDWKRREITELVRA